MRRERENTRISGMSLMEVMVAVVISSVILLGIAGLLVSTARLNTEHKANKEASELCEMKIEELRRISFSSLGSGSDVVGKYTRVWTVTPLTGKPRLKTITLLISWKDVKNRTHQLQYNAKVYRNAYPYK
jgi:prepilin-type N-terminal cleavage/methylation domain-containing protein